MKKLTFSNQVIRGFPQSLKILKYNDRKSFLFYSKVSEEDAVMAIVLYEDSIKWKYGNMMQFRSPDGPP